MGIITIVDILVKSPTVIKNPHNKESILTIVVRTPELRENTPTPVCSIIDVNTAVSRMKFIAFQIKMNPNTTLKMVSQYGCLVLVLFVLIVRDI